MDMTFEIVLWEKKLFNSDILYIYISKKTIFISQNSTRSPNSISITKNNRCFKKSECKVSTSKFKAITFRALTLVRDLFPTHTILFPDLYIHIACHNLNHRNPLQNETKNFEILPKIHIINANQTIRGGLCFKIYLRLLAMYRVGPRWSRKCSRRVSLSFSR